jgi:SpoVK/Ycf46/Vps4 family AAA+-type ATPase
MFTQVRDFKTELTESNVSRDGLVALIAARLFTSPGLHSNYIKHTRRHGFSWEEFLPLVGYEYDYEKDDLYEVQVFQSNAHCLINELSSLNPVWSEVVTNNIDSLSVLLGLSSTDRRVLELFCLIDIHEPFKELTNALGELGQQNFIKRVSHLLSTSVEEVSNSFNKNSKLYKSGLLQIDNSDNRHLSLKADLISGISDVLTTENESPLAMLKEHFYESSKGELTLNDFSFLKIENNLLHNYFEDFTANRAGLNVLIYGEPGTGKTEWVKAIAGSLERPLYEISSESDNGNSLSGSSRVSAFKLAQNALSSNKECDFSKAPLILFDEIEDVFPSSMMSIFISSQSNKSMGKAWMNKLLEETQVPTFWISNAIHQVDDAYIRRFDLVIEIKTPPREVRQEIIRKSLGKLKVSEEWIAELAQQKTLVPAVVARAGSFLQNSISDKAIKTVEKGLLNVINRTLKAQGKKEIKLNGTENSLGYSLDYLNTDIGIEKLVQGMQQSQQGRFCLYGLPGTGKTAFGKHLAEVLDKPLILKKASDLLSPYVGQAEINIAAAFEEAMDEGGILQIDEADSFLQSREKAQRIWEVSQVNELLTQMESYEGVFIASTNLMDNIDSAAMRRFDLKIEFKPLRFDQAWLLLQQLVKPFEGKVIDTCVAMEKLKSLSNLTPGDFATISRKLKFTQIDPSVNNLVELLELVRCQLTCPVGAN